MPHTRGLALTVAFISLLLATTASHILGYGVALDPDAGLNVTALIQRRGYDVETHEVVTADRYVLTMYRLPRSYNESQATNHTLHTNTSKPVVYLIHGLLDSSYTWILNFRTQSLAYVLADAGYDVWLGNNRGTTWSRKHLDFPTTDPRYWNFTWENMATEDLPAMLHYIFNTTGRPTMSYVGHSEGTTQAFAGFSIHQDLAKRVTFLGAFAPVAFLGGTESPVFIALARTYMDQLFADLGVAEFWPKSPLIQGLIGKYGCAFVNVACDSIINAFTGPSDNVNKSRIHVYVTQTPAGTSVKNLVHFAQGIRTDTFRRFDYGCACSRWLPLSLCPSILCKNKVVYGEFDPPAWNLSDVHYPRIGLFTGEHDWLATGVDVAKLKKDLPTRTIVYEKHVRYNHLDFTWAFNAPETIYNDLLTQIKHYEGLGYNMLVPSEKDLLAIS